MTVTATATATTTPDKNDYPDNDGKPNNDDDDNPDNDGKPNNYGYIMLVRPFCKTNYPTRNFRVVERIGVFLICKTTHNSTFLLFISYLEKNTPG